MAGMFYSLQEVAEKLNKTEQQVQQLVKEGKLREFRDGTNVLFKIDEVEALTSEAAAKVPEEPPAASEQQITEDEILLAPESTDQDTSIESKLTDEDTTIDSEGIDVLGKTDTDYQITDDTLGETRVGSGTDEVLLEEIEEDVNLDSFGSGSGLLDLSLQADDTSLGGILDEIYTPEAGQDNEAEGADSEMQVGFEDEQMLPEEEPATPQAGLKAAAAAPALAEPQPDTLSDALGIMLFLPLLAIVYTAIVTIAGFRNVMPVILEKIQGIIWYVTIGLVVAAGIVVGAGFMLAGKSAKPARKPKAKAGKTPPPASEETSETEKAD